MRSSTLIGALIGGAALLGIGGGIAYAVKKKSEGDEPYFLYVMQPGDTLSELALKFFGDAAKAPVLFAALEKPPGSDKQVPVGARIRVPCVWTTVQKGDTLASIAQRVLGDGKRWRRILEANRNASRKAIQDPDKLAVGQRLAVPTMEAPAPSAPSAPEASTTVAVGNGLDLLGAEDW